MEENKDMNGVCANCPCNKCKAGMCCGHKCHGAICKILIPIILLALAFYAGTVVGDKTDIKERFEGRKFMNKDIGQQEGPKGSVSDSVTIEVLPEGDSTNTNTPPVLE